MAKQSLKFSSFHLFNKPDNWSVKEVYDYHIELAEYLEELGFDGVWLAEHHFRDYGVCPSTLGMLSYLAARTTKLKLGTGIVVLPLHNPITIAEEAAQLDLLSNGRVKLGVGRGYQAAEFDRFNVDIKQARDRFNESLDIITKAWTEETFSYHGQYYHFDDVTLIPKPMQRPHPPIYIASISPTTVELSAKRGLPILADPVATFKNVGTAAATWQASMRDFGHNPTNHELCVMRTVYVAASNEKARQDLEKFELGFDRSKIVSKQSAPIDATTGQIAEGFEYWQSRYLKGGEVSTDFRWDQLEVVGDPERVIQQLKLLQSFGYDNIMCDFGSTRPMPISDMKKIIKFFADEVMPAFKT